MYKHILGEEGQNLSNVSSLVDTNYERFYIQIIYVSSLSDDRRSLNTNIMSFCVHTKRLAREVDGEIRLLGVRLNALGLQCTIEYRDPAGSEIQEVILFSDPEKQDYITHLLVI